MSECVSESGPWRFLQHNEWREEIAFRFSVSQLFHGPTPRSPLHRLSIRLRRSRSTTSTEYSLPGATQLSQVRSVSPSEQGGPCRFLPCTATIQQAPSCVVFVFGSLFSFNHLIC